MRGEGSPLLRKAADEAHAKRSLLAKWYYRQGKLCAKYPKLTSLICFVFIAWTCVGLIDVDVESNPEKIWVPPSSVTQLQQLYFNYMFTPFYRIEEVYFTTPEAHSDPGSGANLLQQQYLLAMLELQVRGHDCAAVSRLSVVPLLLPLPL